MRRVLLLLGLPMVAVLTIGTPPPPVAAESCSASMPRQVSFARNYTFTGTLVRWDRGDVQKYEFAIDEVFAGEDRPVTEPVQRELRPGGRITFSGGCFGMRHLTKGPTYLISAGDLLTLSSMTAVAWEVRDDGSVRLIRQYGSARMDPRFAGPRTLSQAIALMVPSLPPTDTADPEPPASTDGAGTRHGPLVTLADPERGRGDLCGTMCEEVHMATNLAIDPELLDRALRVGGERTKKATVTTALEEYIARREQARIVQHFGTLDWDPLYDHKADRRSRDGKLEARR